MMPVILLTMLGKISIYSAFQILLILGFFFFGSYLKPDSRQQINKYSISPYFLVIIGLVYFVTKSEYILDTLFSVLNGSYFDRALSLAVARYNQEEDYTISGQLSIVAFTAYATALAIVNSEKKSTTTFFWIALIFMIFIESSSLSRAGVLIVIAAFSSELIIKNREAISSINLKWFIYAIVVFFILALVFFFSAFFRLGENYSAYVIFEEKIYIYTLGIYEALGVWVSSPDFYFEGGKNTFGSIYKMLGGFIPQGHYQNIRISNGETNVFTNIRGLIQDFTILGACLFYLIAGILIRINERYMSLLGYFLVRSTLLFILFFLHSPFNFTTSALGFILPYLFIFINHLSFLRINSSASQITPSPLNK